MRYINNSKLNKKFKILSINLLGIFLYFPIFIEIGKGEIMKNFIIKLGAAAFYGLLLLLLLGGGSINEYRFKGIIKILIDMFK